VLKLMIKEDAGFLKHQNPHPYYAPEFLFIF